MAEMASPLDELCGRRARHDQQERRGSSKSPKAVSHKKRIERTHKDRRAGEIEYICNMLVIESVGELCGRKVGQSQQ